MSERENERQYRVIDQTLSAHAMLRDRYGGRALFLSISLLGVSIALNAFVFAGDDILVAIFKVPAGTVKVFLGTASVAVMILSIVELRVDWSGGRQSHADAVARLSQLKAVFRRSHDCAAGGARSGDELDALTREYDRVMADLPPISEKQFTKLKADHAFKRMVSEDILSHPGVPAPLVSIRLRCRVTWKLCRKGRSKNADNLESE